MVQTTEERLVRLWEEHFSDYGRGIHMFRTENAWKLVAMGIPGSLRGELWLTFSGWFRVAWRKVQVLGKRWGAESYAKSRTEEGHSHHAPLWGISTSSFSY